MPLRASKMNFFIFGFQRLVWCPKWTPASSNSLTPMLNTSSFGCKFTCHGANHPAEHGIVFVVVMAAGVHSNAGRLQAVCPFSTGGFIPFGGKRGAKITKPTGVANIIFRRFGELSLRL